MKQSTVTYKEALTEIEEILEKIESGELDVDDLAVNVKRVSELLTICKQKLTLTEKEVQKIIEGMES